ncbi:MAG: alanine--tRNA ligase [Candidatus Magasanikbacteria bacterium CG10_big_fil_rev_8_21_14_0_10_40_10]|uniref:Alanine--tRNA ligase n=1 Tax=Candidatus Magasanikbacteria bacterium CG10_big_fil_rev_8_21_14_0_10_40_10 TaxID=1974648 RepID=A0A2M6W4Z8_9BACT|nr:MAG: alanine--tRNA ligase [Candidatus Magasanikbacteria bacterium CG10_big_fil_rev_8_21_14_0_10_40_10]
MTALELRKKYLDFFASKKHQIISSASLIPENDPTVLFTTAGMHPLVPFLLGEKHAQGNRLTNIQKCVRTGDIDEVGDLSHCTFFEMLGNWSLGDYFNKEAIVWAWEFVTGAHWLNLDPRHLSVTVFGGDKRFNNLHIDLDSAQIWQNCGVAKHKIAQMPNGVLEREGNWWGPAGITGPCGPCTEIYYWIGSSALPPESSNPATDPNNWLEIWNIVLMKYNKTINNTFEELNQKNIDTGMGLERTLVVLNHLHDVYQIDTLYPLIQTIEEISGRPYALDIKTTKAMRVMADHIRSAVMIIGDERGISPSNTDQGYIVRRLLRRAIRAGHDLDINNNFCAQLAGKVIEIFADIYPTVSQKRDFVMTEISQEESKFRNTLEKGLKKFGQILQAGVENNTISAKQTFDLYQSYGFPLEMTMEMAKENNLKVDSVGFNSEMKIHQDLSRLGAGQRFKGGLADASEISKKYHTATHLLHASLRAILGQHVEQKGSNINASRLRFDFSHPQKMTPQELQAVQDLVNQAIKADYAVNCDEMSVESAKQAGAIGLFADKYADLVKVYTVGQPNLAPKADPTYPTFSKEICGGPHVRRTGLLGDFHIIKEEASSSGVRRIKAILREIN